MKFVSIHSHSTYSYMDGFGLPEDHVARVADLGMSALALTEHGNVSSHVKLELAAKKHGIKPIFGLEAYTAPADMRETKNMRKWHQTIVAMNHEGYQNLNRLVTRSWDEGFYRWPSVTGGMLKDCQSGLIVTSGCSDSLVNCSLLGGKGIQPEDAGESRAIGVIQQYKRTFGDRYYLEVQRFPELERTRHINKWLAYASRKTGVPLVATADVHYPFPDNNQMQKILHAAGRNTGTVAAAEAGWEYDILLTYPTSDDQVVKQLVATGLSRAEAQGAIEATSDIASRCNVEIPKMERVRFPLDSDPRWKKGMTSAQLFRLWLNDGWTYRGFHRLSRKLRREYAERVEYEFDLFADKDFLDYFLMLSDAVRACKDNGIPVGPARGSAAASLALYLLRITEVNPMHYPLMFFERFVDPNRFDLPDVDLDFDDDLRDYVRQHMITRYGVDRVGNIGTFTRYRGKNAIDDVARVYSIPKWEANIVKDLLVTRSGGDSRFDASIGDTIAMFPQAKEVFDRHPRLYEAIALEGNYKGFGVHAAGLVVGATRLTDSVATYVKHDVGKNKNTLAVLSVDKYDGEDLGMLKLDALSLATMGMIRLAIETIGMTLEELYAIPMTEPETLKAFHNGDVKGIFQFDGRTMKMVTEQLRPDVFMDLAAVNALSRPGPLHSGSTGEYIAIRHGHIPREPIHPIVDRITAMTEGQIIYQEQILQICREVGKFPWVHAAAIRKIISQKKGEAAFESMWKDFLTGAQSQGISEEVARKIWNRMVTAGTYAFNVAHCVSYSMLGFWAMWLKVHHPLAFYAAQLQKVKKERQLELMRDMQDERFSRSFPVLPPDPNQSAVTWSVSPDGNGVIAGLSQIPGVGLTTARAIIDEREENGQFSGWADLVAVKGIGPKSIASMVAFCEQDDPFEIHKIERESAEIKAWIKASGFMHGIPMPDTLSSEVPYEDRKSYHTIMGIVNHRNYQDMYEDHRARYGEDLNPDDVKDSHLKDSMTMFMEDEHGPISVKVNRWTYPKYKQQLWDLDIQHHYVIAKVVKNAFYGKNVSVQEMWVVDPCPGKCILTKEDRDDKEEAA
jgi:DNA polymerase-3 subunit alpha